MEPPVRAVLRLGICTRITWALIRVLSNSRPA